jgi:hypothetical protein
MGALGPEAALMAYRMGSRWLAKRLWNPNVARRLTTPRWISPWATGAGAAGAMSGATGYLQNPPGQAQGGAVQDLERRALDRGAVLAHLVS